MALISCPECGNEISDKANKCVHCGKVLVEEKIEELKCEECGSVLSETDEKCPNCGCPIENKEKNDDKKPQQVEVAGIKMNNKTKKIIIIAVAVILLSIVAVVSIKVYSNKKAKDDAKKQEEQAQLDYEESYNVYIDNLVSAKSLMLVGGGDAESLCNLTLRVWYNAIYEERDDETDEFTRPNGYFVDDFNDAIGNLYSDSDTKATILDIESNQTAVKEIMKDLQNPPEGLEGCYETISSLYESYKTLTDLAINPSGNYGSFSSNKSDAVSEFMSAYEKLDIQIPDKIQ